MARRAFLFALSALAASANDGQRRRDVAVGLLVYGDGVGPCVDESLGIEVWTRKHQVHVERKGDGTPAHLHEVGAEAQVGHEVTVHDVKVKLVGATGLACAGRVEEVAPVGRQH